MLLLHLALPLAGAARALLAEKGWNDFGYARLEDHARERFGRSGQWVRDHAALADACSRLDGLARALTGEDGGAPVGLVAARLIGSIASQDSLKSWLRLARGSTARELRDAVRRAKEEGSCWPETTPSPGDEKLAGNAAESVPADVQAEPDSPRNTPDPQRLWIHVPYPVKAAFEEALDLYRAVEGRQLAPAEFVEALVAEAASGSLAGRLGDAASSSGGAGAHSVPAGRTETKAAHLCQSACVTQDESILRADAQQMLRRLSVPHPGENPDGTIRKILTLQDEIERELGALLARMARTATWQRFGHSSLDSYAECCLGLSRSAARDRLMLHRTLPRLPVLADAYGEGRIGFASTLQLLRMLRPRMARGPVPSSLQQAWVERAAQATVKRLQDEARAILRNDAGSGPHENGFRPLGDAAWHASLFREAGTTRRRIHRLTALAIKSSSPLVPLCLTLPPATAGDFMDALAAAKNVGVRMFLGDEPKQGRRSTPAWLGLLVLLREFAETWDADHSGRRKKSQAISMRDGWRCMAPGCTSRRHLENHHVIYRSHNGDDTEANLVCLCRFHHQLGEHGGLAKVRGRAPLGLLWILGRQGRGGRFLNERRLAFRTPA